MYPLRIVSLKCRVWPAAADKRVSLIYGGAVKWLLSAVNIGAGTVLETASIEQVKRKGQEDGEGFFCWKEDFMVHPLSPKPWFGFPVVIELKFSAPGLKNSLLISNHTGQTKGKESTAG